MNIHSVETAAFQSIRTRAGQKAYGFVSFLATVAELRNTPYGIRRRSTTSGSASSRTACMLIGLARIIRATKPATWAE